MILYYIICYYIIFYHIILNYNIFLVYIYIILYYVIFYYFFLTFSWLIRHRIMRGDGAGAVRRYAAWNVHGTVDELGAGNIWEPGK